MNGMDFEKYNLSQPSTISKMGSKRLWQNVVLYFDFIYLTIFSPSIIVKPS